MSEKNLDLSARVARFSRLAHALESDRAAWVAALGASCGRLRTEAEGEVALTLKRLRGFGRLARRLAGRAPVGGVAVVLAGNAALSNPVAALGTAWLAGNRVVGRFPTANRAWAERVERWLGSHLAGLDFDHRPGPEFLTAALADPAIDVVMVFGDDRWGLGYEEAVRRSGTRMIFEGPGKDPFLVLPGADLERAARAAVRGAFFNAGQACTSPERFYVHRTLVEPFLDLVLAATARRVPGLPDEPGVDLGPVLSPRQAARIETQVRDAVARGAELLAGGRAHPARLRDGRVVTVVEPTVLVGCDPSMAVLQEETFGPVIAVQTVASENEALALAEDHRYGLAASVYGGSRGAPARLAASHGLVFCNQLWLDYFWRRAHPPYGGRKLSGWVWGFEDGCFVRRDGPRRAVLELSRPTSSSEIRKNHGDAQDRARRANEENT